LLVALSAYVLGPDSTSAPKTGVSRAEQSEFCREKAQFTTPRTHPLLEPVAIGCYKRLGLCRAVRPDRFSASHHLRSSTSIHGPDHASHTRWRRSRPGL
jgi:hypothetical protein